MLGISITLVIPQTRHYLTRSQTREIFQKCVFHSLIVGEVTIHFVRELVVHKNSSHKIKNIIGQAYHHLFFLLYVSSGQPLLRGWMFMLPSWMIREATLISMVVHSPWSCWRDLVYSFGSPEISIDCD